ncbi:hypothetical protein [Chloroflexus sp. MS-G]|jgi:hypothetical protein|uniref:hypothetical protein n=1 Tax=Chloroflexus sp. MS-G TaxID=1521187 RepID=UPI0004DF3782|nr:hypothetical protein [Chloroflexus sp. MS-G]
MRSYTELQACEPIPIKDDRFNASAQLPYGLQIEHIRAAMTDFLQFLHFVNSQLHTKGIQRLETLLMPANFSSILSDFMVSAIPKYCNTVVKNTYHNGYPDLIPAGMFPNNAVQHVAEGVEIKASRHRKGWQGHNPEDGWLMVFVFDSNRPRDTTPRPFRFVAVMAARLQSSDWSFAGRSATSRRTITASVIATGYQKLVQNWIYRD